MTDDEHAGPDLLTPPEVARLFGVDPKTVTCWAKAGRLSIGSRVETAVQAIDLTHSFGNRRVLAELNLEVRRGQSVVIMGRSGVGSPHCSPAC
jgi:ABC-type transport system involved in cytochrome bd biosynthesis fused ATPase/permease subunit